MKIPKKVRVLLGLAVSLASVGVLVFGFDWYEVWLSLASVRYTYLIPAAALVALSYLGRSLQWRAVLAQVRRVSLLEVFGSTMVGYLANNVLPAQLGELVRVYILSYRQRLSRGTALGSAIVSRLLDGAVLFFILGMFAVFIPAKFAGILPAGLTAFVIYLALVGFFLLFFFKRRYAVWVLDHTLARVSRGAAARVLGVLVKFLHGFSCFKSPRDLVLSFAYTIMIWVCICLSYYTLSLGFAFPRVPIYGFLFVTAFVSIVVTLPSSPGYVGIMELGMIAALHVINPDLTRNEALSFAVIAHGLQLVVSSVLGLLFTARFNLKLKEVAKVPAGSGA